jgi:hypothetical protein
VQLLWFIVSSYFQKVYGLPELPFRILSGINSGVEEIRAKLDFYHSLGLLKTENLAPFLLH